jgi:DNA-binding FadR family transcriptional regulator
MPIDVLPELTAAQQDARQALRRWLDALKSSDREQCRRAMQEYLAAGQRKREVWLAMATPLPTTE